MFNSVDELLAHGVEHCTQQMDNQDCGICLDPFTQPVRIIACGHILDRVCLQTWLRSRTSTLSGSCPVCRRVLIRPLTSDEEISQLRELLTSDSFGWRTFGLDTTDRIQLVDAPSLHGNLFTTVLEAGQATVQIEPRKAMTALVMFGNGLILKAFVQGFPLPPEQLQQLELEIQAAYGYCEEHGGEERRVVDLPISMVHGAMARMVEDGREIDPNMFDDGMVDGDHPGFRLAKLCFSVTWAMWLCGTDGNVRSRGNYL